MIKNTRKDLGKILKQRRLSIPMTLRELSAKSGVSQSHLTRIERGERFPSALVLRKIAKILTFEENKLFSLAGFLSPSYSVNTEISERYSYNKGLDPYVAAVLAQEPLEVQRTVVIILNILKSIAKPIGEEQR
jgi:transcriptional regulator with XRE-family HTH domain